MQVGFAADMVGPRVAACDNGRLGLLEVRGAEPLRPRTADAPAVEQVPRRGNLGLGNAPEVGIMLVPSLELQLETANQRPIHFSRATRNRKFCVGGENRSRPRGVRGTIGRESRRE